LQEFNLGLKEVIEDGTYSEFVKKYEIQDNDVNSILDQYTREKLIVGLEDYAPFEYIDLEGELSGIGYELMLEALCRMGYSESNYEFVVYPWSRLMELGRNGGVDVILDAFYSEERQEHFSYSDEIYMQSDYYFIALEHNNISYDGHVFSKPIETIGIVRDYEYGEAIVARLSDYQELIDEVGTTDELIEGLLNGRYDVVLGGESFSKFYMKEHKRNEKLSFLWQPLNSLKSYIMYPLEKEHDALEEAVDKKMKTFRDDGTYDKILKFYLE
jgi:polar amino acid transport system substrate-binding protein